MLLSGLQNKFIWIRGKVMSELNYKELQEQGVFDIPYRAFVYMQKQHKRIKELELINFDSELHFDAAKSILIYYRNVLMMLWRSAIQALGNKAVSTILN